MEWFKFNNAISNMGTISYHTSFVEVSSISTRVLLVPLIGKARLELISTPLVVMRAKCWDEVRSSPLLGSATCDKAADLLLNCGRGEVLKSRSCFTVRLLRDGIERLLLPYGWEVQVGLHTLDKVVHWPLEGLGQGCKDEFLTALTVVYGANI